MTIQNYFNPIFGVMGGVKSASIVSVLGAIMLASGCASNKVSTHPLLSESERLPKPDHVLIYDFVPSSSGTNSPMQTKVGEDIAQGLIMGSVTWGLQPYTPQVKPK